MTALYVAFLYAGLEALGHRFFCTLAGMHTSSLQWHFGERRPLFELHCICCYCYLAFPFTTTARSWLLQKVFFNVQPFTSPPSTALPATCGGCWRPAIAHMRWTWGLRGPGLVPQQSSLRQ